MSWKIAGLCMVFAAAACGGEIDAGLQSGDDGEQVELDTDSLAAEYDYEGSAEDDEALRTPDSPTTPTRIKMMKRALGQVGVCESGNNGGTPLYRYTRHFGSYGPLPWCAFFVSWAWDTASNNDHKVPWSNPGYTGSIYSYAKAKGKLVGSPAQGDIFGYNSMGHTGIVTSVNRDRGTFNTVEGNYSNCVKRTTRSYKSGSYWFARMQF